ncbi:hypothetical protein CEP52_002837 [Fusarium oligoseptatum]|uniref:Uncharacterized protein n=1 Tax=Fusarium oligoseptatum TaxID=2604345 RepID=A0A428UBL1_9HYPO|nr:hypothetical protein CEP52_002837 [Fusarium oligoseptatum]
MKLNFLLAAALAIVVPAMAADSTTETHTGLTLLAPLLAPPPRPRLSPPPPPLALLHLRADVIGAAGVVGIAAMLAL